MRYAPMVWVAVSCVLVFASPASARCGSVPECALSLNVGGLHAKITAIAGATVITGLALTWLAIEARRMYERPLPDGVFMAFDATGRPRLQLTLVPTPSPVPASSPGDEATRPPSGVFRFNEKATNVAVAVGGAAVVAGMIYGLINGR